MSIVKPGEQTRIHIQVFILSTEQIADEVNAQLNTSCLLQKTLAQDAFIVYLPRKTKIITMLKKNTSFEFQHQ